MHIQQRTTDPLDTVKDQMIRQYLVETDPEDIEQMVVRDWGVGRDELTDLALSLSLCPVHFIDYAICFDDQTLRCGVVREIHPGHDT